MEVAIIVWNNFYLSLNKHIQFSNTTTKAGILQRLEARTNIGDAGITGDATLLLQFTASVNAAYMKATQLILTADGTWDWDDTNMDNMPRATTNLVENQSEYQVMDSLPTTKQDWLEVKEVNIQNSSGDWYKLSYKAEKNFNTPRSERDTVAGQPSTFSFNGTQIFLDVKPNYSATKGLQVLYNRAPLEFASTDTTKRPGFSTLFHEYLVLKPLYEWERDKSVGNSEQTKRDIIEMEKEIGKFYNNRNKYAPTMMQRPPSQTRRGYR